MGAALAAAPSAANAGAVDLFVERTVLHAADQRCGLLAPETSAALAAGAAQARGAALKQGLSERAARSLEQRARVRAGELSCAAPELVQSARRVEESFKGYARIIRMTYPGDQAAWRADRTLAREARWRLSQESRFGRDRMIFGLAGRQAPGALMAVGLFADGAQPYGARLVMRDTSRTLGPYLPQKGEAAGAGLAGRMPQGAALKAYIAEARSPAGADLLPKDEREGWAIRFPGDAVRALSELDPREAVAVQFLFPGDRVRTAYVEVGDFAAGRAFVQMAAR
ncbi:hypothetical protein [Phenylobacterium sp.]|uniref:hypothetical protein n=1 Tax=Phenylobacterium sp. TaxID=1871053 RepID=UPI003919AF1D